MILAATYEELEKLDHQDDLTLLKGLLESVYDLKVPKDLLEIAFLEVVDPSYYDNHPHQIRMELKRRKIYEEYKEDWNRDRYFRRIPTQLMDFYNYVRHRVKYKLRFQQVNVLNYELEDPRNMTFDNIVHFFENRGGFIRHPRTLIILYLKGAHLHDMVVNFHQRLHNLEHKIADKLNFIEQDYCCPKDIEIDSLTTTPEPWRIETTTNPYPWYIQTTAAPLNAYTTKNPPTSKPDSTNNDITTDSWNVNNNPTTDPPDYTTDQYFPVDPDDWNGDTNTDNWNTYTTPAPPFVPTESWNDIGTTAIPWNENGSGDVENSFDDFKNEQDNEEYTDDDQSSDDDNGFGFDDEEEEEDGFGIDGDYDDDDDNEFGFDDGFGDDW